MSDIIETFRADVKGGPRGHIQAIAAATGVKVKTLRNLYYGETNDLRYHNARPLIDYYAARKVA